MEQLSVPIEEKVLRAMSKNLSVTFHTVESDYDDREKTTWLQHRLASLLATASAPNLSSGHRTAACNVLCGTVEKCLASSVGCFVSQVSSEALFDGLQRLYFERYHSAAQKSMKQVLAVIVKLQINNLSLRSVYQPLYRSLKEIFQILFRNQERVKAKPALHLLHQYILRELICSSQILTLFQEWSVNGDLLSRDVSSVFAFQQFFTGILEWVKFADIAPSVGQFVTPFLKNLAQDTPAFGNLQQSEMSPWMEPLLHCIANHSENIRAFKTYILPGLFQHDTTQFWKFLQLLRVEKHLGLATERSVVDEGVHPPCDLITERLVLFSALQVGKEQGLISDINDTAMTIEERDGVVHIARAVLGRLLDHISPETRLSGLTLLVISSRSTRPYTPCVLETLSRSLPNFFADADPNFRGEVQSLVKVLVNRLRVISAALYKASLNDKGVSSEPTTEILAATLFEDHKAFVAWFIRFLTFEMHPAASYQRHISALKSLIAVLRSGLDRKVPEKCLSRPAKTNARWPFHLDVFQPALKRALLDALLDPFDDVRQAALESLKLTAENFLNLNYSALDVQHCILGRARHLMAQSGRLDQSDGVARLYDLFAHNISCMAPTDMASASIMSILEGLLSYVEEAVAVANAQLSTAVSKYSLHGYITAIRYIIEQNAILLRSLTSRPIGLTHLLDRIFRCLTEIWNFVKPLLCNDAPEGFMPDGLQDGSDLTTKDILSFAWRALKESSLLLGALVSPVTIELYSWDSKIKNQHLLLSGDLCFTQLAELRHRGAFSTAAQTFAALCRQCVLSQDIEIQSLPIEWYKRALALIERNGAITTRRSAGIPALIVGILAAEPRMPQLRDVISNLCKIAMRPAPSSSSPDTELPQVHALNSLKAIFHNSSLGEQCECHIVHVIGVACTCLGSDIWSIRNCGLMVFRGLIDRLLGSNESLDDALGSNQSRFSSLSYERYPGLIDLVNRLLSITRPAVESSMISSARRTQRSIPLEAVFTVLDLLRRAPPPQGHLLEMRSLVLQASKSPHWHIRDLAARTFVASLCTSNLFEVIIELLPIPSSDKNEVHGHLLCIKYAIDSFTAEYHSDLGDVSEIGLSDLFSKLLDIGQVDKFLSLVISDCERLFKEETSLLVKAAYLRLLNSFAQLILKVSKTRRYRPALNRIKQELRSVSVLIESLPRQKSIIEKEAVLNRCLVFLITAETQEIERKDLGFPNIATSFPARSFLRNPEVFRSVLQSLDLILQGAGFESRELFAKSLACTLQNCYDVQLLRDGERVLMGIVKSFSRSQFTSSTELSGYFTDLDVGKRLLNQQRPHTTEHDIIVWGLSLFVKWQRHSSSTAILVTEAESWIATVQYSLLSSNDVSWRRAAIESMKEFVPVFLGSPSFPSHLQMKCALAVYDALNDDDDELRELAAEVSSLLLENNIRSPPCPGSVVPVVSSRMLVARVVRRHRTCPQLMRHAVDRLIQLDSRRSDHLKTVFERLNDIKKDELELFVIEKQNLYIDEVRQAKFWSSILQSMPVKIASPEVLNRLTTWVLDGLGALIDFLSSEDDGPLGWASKADTFILGIRVFRAAETLIVWCTSSKTVKLKVSTVLMKLQELYTLGKEKNLHEMWLETIENILGKALIRTLETVLAALKRLPINIC